MKKTRWFVIPVALASAGSLWAHHSLTNYDTSKAVRVKGTVVQFQNINPHSIIFVDQKDADGQTHRWAIEGPAGFQLTRNGFAKDVLKPGDVVEVCGYVPKESVNWRADADSGAKPMTGWLINAETLVMPDGKQQTWGDYGVHKCFPPGFVDQHSSK